MKIHLEVEQWEIFANKQRRRNIGTGFLHQDLNNSHLPDELTSDAGDSGLGILSVESRKGVLAVGWKGSSLLLLIYLGGGGSKGTTAWDPKTPDSTPFSLTYSSFLSWSAPWVRSGWTTTTSTQKKILGLDQGENISTRHSNELN